MKQKPDFVVLSTNCGAQEDRLVGIVGIGAPLGSHHRQKLEKVGETNEKGGDCLCLEKETTKTPCMSKIRVVSQKKIKGWWKKEPFSKVVSGVEEWHSAEKHPLSQ